SFRSHSEYTLRSSSVLFSNATASDIYTLSLHDALPICQKATLWIISLISLSFIILLLLLLLGRRQHLINVKNKKLLAEHQLENTRLKVDQLNSEIQSKQRDLSDFALNLLQNQPWAEMLATKIKQLKSGNSKDT